MVPPVHFYHLFCGQKHQMSAWESPVSDHFRRLKVSRFTGTVYVSLIGEWSFRNRVRQWLKENWVSAEILGETDFGHEQYTLSKLRNFARLAEPETPIYYAHPKGSYHPDAGYQNSWRRGMESMLTDDWDDRVEELTSHDAVGLHWLTPQQFDCVSTPFFGGNFWWATAGYLARLPEPSTEDRHAAEAWIGLGNPHVLDLSPGWPTYSA